MKNYYTTEKYLNSFLRDVLRTNDIHLKQLDYRFILDFEHYVRNYEPPTKRKTCSNNGTMKHMARLCKMVHLAVKMEWLERDPFQRYKLRIVKTERSFLNQRELDLIEDTSFKRIGYERVKDVFLFACYTVCPLGIS